MPKKKKGGKITPEDQYKMLRRARRLLDPKPAPGGTHKTDKKDIEEKKSNTIKEWE